MGKDDEKPLLTFNAFSLQDKDQIQSFSSRYAPYSCEYCFATLFIWQKIYGLSWTIYQDRLLIYTAKYDKMFMPLGEPFSPEELTILSTISKDQGLSTDFIQVDQSYIEQFPQIEKMYSVCQDSDSDEYIYETQTLWKLPGRKLHKKRNLISQFKKKYPDHTILPIQGNLKTYALDLALNLMRSKKRPSRTLLEEWEVIQKSFNDFEAIGLEGIVLFAEEKVAAFSVYSQISEHCFDIHFEKSDIRFKGAAQVINQETAKTLKSRCGFVNREQDMGIKGLRRAKMSYQPSWMLKPLTLTRNKA